MTRILVTGSRYWTDIPAVRNAIAKVITDQPYGTHCIVVHGDCPTGADQIARDFLDELEAQRLDYVSQEAHPALWKTDGYPQAGPMRNQRMVDLGADVCLAFPLSDSRGTTDCMRRAKAAGIPVINCAEEL